RCGRSRRRRRASSDRAPVASSHQKKPRTKVQRIAAQRRARVLLIAHVAVVAETAGDEVQRGGRAAPRTGCRSADSACALEQLAFITAVANGDGDLRKYELLTAPRRADGIDSEARFVKHVIDH